MKLAAFIGAFLAVSLGIFIIYRVIRNKLRRFTRRVFGTTDLGAVLREAENAESQSPKSLRGCDRLMLPKVLAEFPDFDAPQAESYARAFLLKELSSLSSLYIHNIVISDYISTPTQKTIVYQAAVACEESGRTCQKRYEFRYAYRIVSSQEAVAANCPNCGGALGYGVTECPYCGSRVTNVLGNCWVFSDLKEC